MDRLERLGIGARERAGVVEQLASAGYVDDARFARDRAQKLAERGLGDAAIRADLEGRAVPAQFVDEALASVDPERERARREAARLGGGVRAARTLARKGFAEESLDGLFAPGHFPPEGQLLG
jgi:regulatory protein